MTERWVLLTQFNSAYEISDLGKLRSVERIDEAGAKRISQLMSLRVTKKYYCSGIRFNKAQKTVRVHRLVAEAFVPNPNNYPIVNHLDGDTLNNAYWNLEWTDHLGNTIHAIENRLTRNKNGELTLTSNQVMAIFNSIETTEALSKRYKVCLVTINGIRNGRTWSWLTGKKYKSKDGNRKYLEINGEKISYAALARRIGTTPPTLTYRLKKGWSIDKIMSVAPKKKGIVRWTNSNQKERIYAIN